MKSRPFLKRGRQKLKMTSTRLIAIIKAFEYIIAKLREISN